MAYPSRVVLSSFITSKMDVQRNITWQCTIDVAAAWIESLCRFDLKGVVFHDCIEFDVPENITLVRITPRTGFTLYEERWFLYAEFLKRNPNIEWVLMTDLSDVVFVKNPFDVISKKGFLYCGDELVLIKNNTWITGTMVRAYGKVYNPDLPVLNCGIVGGHSSVVNRTLRALTDLFIASEVKGRELIDMHAICRCGWDIFGEEGIIRGYPLHSKFKRFEKTGEFAIIHK